MKNTDQTQHNQQPAHIESLISQLATALSLTEETASATEALSTLLQNVTRSLLSQAPSSVLSEVEARLISLLVSLLVNYPLPMLRLHAKEALFLLMPRRFEHF
jgi:hypothetical protein